MGDYIFVNKLSFYFKTPKYIPFTSIKLPNFGFRTFGVDRGDIVVFEYPGARDLVEPAVRNINYIKRCIALPGDTLQVIGKQAYVNGKAVVNAPGLRCVEDTMPKGVTMPDVFPRGQWPAE